MLVGRSFGRRRCIELVTSVRSNFTHWRLKGTRRILRDGTLRLISYGDIRGRKKKTSFSHSRNDFLTGDAARIFMGRTLESDGRTRSWSRKTTKGGKFLEGSECASKDSHVIEECGEKNVSSSQSKLLLRASCSFVSREKKL